LPFLKVDVKRRALMMRKLLSGVVASAMMAPLAAAAPWRSRSALDAVELMDVGWNFRREHLRPQQRSHYVIPDGGDQPNVVPQSASVWYYFRELDFDHIKESWDIGNRMSKAAAMMTDTEVSMRVLGTAWPAHMNKTVAEAMYENIKAVGLPKWSADDEKLAVALQHELKVAEVGLEGNSAASRTREAGGQRKGIWRVSQAWEYYRNVQTKDRKYVPLIRPDDKPAIWLNEQTMARYRPEMKKYYYDPTKYKTYLDQLGIRYPTVR
jgi:hypothetical protein